MYRVQSRRGARAGARRRSALARRRRARPARRRAAHDQGEHRHARRSGADRHARERRRAAAARRRAARGARARGGLRDPRQDHHARLRHAVVGPVEPARRSRAIPGASTATPSGSSSGAAAAAVAGYAPLHIGTDIGGSVRLPATHCGIFALKPSLGRVPIHPPYMGRVAGPMTRTVEDAALADERARAPGRARLHVACRTRRATFAAASTRSSRSRSRIGFVADMGVGLAVHREVRAAVRSRRDRARRARAAASSRCAPSSPRRCSTACAASSRRARTTISMQLPPARREKVLPFIAEWCTWRAAQLHRARRHAGVCAGDGDARGRRRGHRAPTTSSSRRPRRSSPYEAELAAPGNDPRNALPHIAFTVPYNMSEQPAASINWSYSADGLPIGVQVVGQRFDDAGRPEALPPDREAAPAAASLARARIN